MATPLNPFRPPAAPIKAVGATEIDITAGVDASDLRRVLIPAKLPHSEWQRRQYGRHVDLGVIQQALLQADCGLMIDLTDLENESMMLDPHLSSVARKRLGSIACLDWYLDPAEGPGIDKATADMIAGVVRAQLQAIPQFSTRLVDLAWADYHNRGAHEIHWMMQPGRIRWRPIDLAWIHPRRLSFGPEREVRIINTQRRIGNFTEDGFALRDFPGKFITYKPRLFCEYPEREGLGPRSLYWTFFKRFSWRMRNALTELFSIPWRIVEVDKDAAVDQPALDSAFEATEKLGQTNTAAIGKGMKLNVVTPGERSGTLVQMTNEDVDKQMSKLWLGQTGTTDAEANRAETIVMKSEQDIVLQTLAAGISESIQRDLVNVIVVLNFGSSALDHCPRFRIDAEPPRDKAKELASLKETLTMAVPVALSQLQEAGGVRPVEDDEPFVVAEKAGTDAFGNPVSGGFKLIDPTEPEPEPEPPASPPAPVTPPEDDPDDDDEDDPDREGGLEDRGADGQAENAEQDLLAATAARPLQLDADARTITSNHGHDVNIPDEHVTGGGSHTYSIKGSADHEHRITVTDADFDALKAGNEVTVTSTAAKKDGEDEEHDHQVTLRWNGARTDSPGDLDDDNPVITARIHGQALTLPFAGFKDFAECVAVITEEGNDAEAANRICGALKEAFEAERSAAPNVVDALAITCATPRVPKGSTPGKVHGSVEQIVEAETEEATSHLADMADQFITATRNATSISARNAAIKRTFEQLDLEPLARNLQRTLMLGAMLGALDSDWESENDAVVRPAPFARNEAHRIELLKLQGRVPNFVRRPFGEAIRAFLARQIVDPDTFVELIGAARRRAFTISGIASQRMLAVVQREIGSTISDGLNERDAAKRLAQGLEDAGFSPLKPSRAQVVIRNATMAAYNSGRDAQMSQPAVLEARPYWQVLTVRDNRQRPNHGDAHGKVLAASDPFWETGPPWGHNCRCRKVSRSSEDVERLGLEVVTGAEMPTLPDPGWDGSSRIG